jgi:hypothetical protein
MNDQCAWPEAADHSAGGDRRHLVADVRVAEELAMRYADSRFDSKSAHGRLRSECEAKLFEHIARSHNVTPSDVEYARRELALDVWDPPVHLPIAAFYITAALLLARSVRRRFPSDEKVPAVVTTLFISVVLALGVQVLGHLWDGVIEMIRVGDTHMSYRLQRLGWRRYSMDVFLFAMVAFWCVVWLSYRLHRPRATLPGFADSGMRDHGGSSSSPS